jgi:dihydroorotate dehydrogenase
LKSITLTRNLIDSSGSIPIILKISPDVDRQAKENIAELKLEYKIDGLTVSNTTISRDSCYNESGGLSGRPLFQLSTE